MWMRQRAAVAWLLIKPVAATRLRHAVPLWRGTHLRHEHRDLVPAGVPRGLQPREELRGGRSIRGP